MTTTQTGSLLQRPIPDNQSTLNAWEQIQQSLEETLGEHIYRGWFAHSRMESLEGGVLTIGLPSEYFATQIRNHYQDLIDKIYLTLPDLEVGEVRFIVCQSTAVEAVEQGIQIGSKSEYTAPVQPRLSYNEPPRTLEAHVEHDGNRTALLLARAVAEADPGSVFPFFIIVGEPATGKTLLMTAMWNRMKAHQRCKPSFKPRAFTTRRFKNDYVNGSREKGKDGLKWLDELPDCDLLCFDDFHILSGGSPSTQEVILGLVKDFVQRNPKGQVIMTMNCHPCNFKVSYKSEYAKKGDENPAKWMESILRGACVVTIRPPNSEALLKIAKLKVSTWKDVSITTEAIQAIIDGLGDGDSREIDIILSTCYTLAFLGNKVVDANLVSRVVKDRTGKSTPKPVTAGLIIETTAGFFGLKVSEMKGHSREKKYCQPRQVAMSLCFLHLKMTDPEIGKIFGKDRATVCNARSSVTKKLETDDRFAEQFEDLQRRLGLVPMTMPLE
ncbi:MAG: helix-turn-helix domain-containing protein [Candidatus Buchananbacteria bacterium]